MNEIIKNLEGTIEDEILSKSEKKSLKALLAERTLTEDQLNFLRSKVYEIASARATPENFDKILLWIKNANNALLPKSGAKADAYFSPGEACRNVIIQKINAAVAKVQICVFTISDDWITNAIISSHQRGVEVSIITDNDKSLDQGSDINSIAKAGISVRMDATPNHMHHKFMVCDLHSVITGSYNWTLSAARYNHENILVTQDLGIVNSYAREFDDLWKQMKPY
ncbi:MAG: phospholipase D-like domain-containing protein [Cyclobacteriaceae bacterium]